MKPTITVVVEGGCVTDVFIEPEMEFELVIDDRDERDEDWGEEP